MAKNVTLIPGEKSNWEIAFFLLIDKMVPFLKPNANFNRQDLVCTPGMDFLFKLLGSIGYKVNNTLENSLQGTINTMVKKKGYMTSDYGSYTLTAKGYERLIEIRKKYVSQNIEPIGNFKKISKMLDLLPVTEKEEVMRLYLKQ